MTRVFFDMDGVLAEYRETELEALYSEGYFRNLKPYTETLKALQFLSSNPDFEVYTLSAYLGDSKYALDEKKSWVNQYLAKSKIKSLFLPCGNNKADVVPGGIRPTDILIDDYNVNLKDWEKYAVAIKFLNGINHKHGSWKGLTARNDALDIMYTVYNASQKPA